MQTPERTPAQQAAVEKELVLLDWVITEAQLAHETAKTHAVQKGKPISMAALRIAVQAQSRRMGLLGIAPAPRRGSGRITAEQLAAEITETRERLAESIAAPPAPPAAPYLNRAQRRAQEKSRAKRKAA